MNIVETACVLLGISCMLFALMLHNGESFQGINICNTLLQVFGMIFAAVVVSIELMLFHLQYIKFKFFTFVYYIVELLSIIWINSVIPFSGLIVITTFSILKNISRVFLVENIYLPLGYYELCKKFGIKVKKPVVRKKKATAKKSISVVKDVKAKAKSSTKSRKRVEAKTTKSYA